MSFQIKIENLSPDVGVVELTQDDGVLHTLAAGEHVTINVADIGGIAVRKVEAGEEEEVAPKKKKAAK